MNSRPPRKRVKYHVEVNLRRQDDSQPWWWEIYATEGTHRIAQSPNGYRERAEAVAAGQSELARWLEEARVAEEIARERKNHGTAQARQARAE